MRPPLVDPEVDLTDFPFMPITIARLKQSRAWLVCKKKPALAFYMLNLWMASWHGRPAASLEDDDLVLADIAMCDEKTWARVKTDVLRGWVRCSDARLYHPVVAEHAADAWERKTARRNQTEAARLAKEKARLEKLLADRAEVARLVALTEDPTASVTDTVTEPVASPAANSKGQGQGQGQGQGNLSLRSDDAGDAGGEREISSDELFRRVYPKDTEPAGVKRELAKIIARGDVALEDIILGARRYATEVKGRENQHIASPVRWLLDGRWRDYESRRSTEPIATTTFVRSDDRELWEPLAERFLCEHRKQPPKVNGGWHFPNEWIQEIRESVPA